MSPAVLFLGASPQQLAPLEYARRAGYRVVTCDNRPENPGHRLADVAHDVSTVDVERVIEVARRERVDGVVCYASDVAAPTAAAVARALGLPGNPVEGVATLTDKARFRELQASRGDLAPAFVTLAAAELARPEAAIDRVACSLAGQLVVKPVDASGGKGVSKVDAPDELGPALVHAARFSRSGPVIVEQQLEPSGEQICGEGFLLDGRIVFHAFADEHFAPGLVVPVGETFPSIADRERVEAGVAALQGLFDEVGMRQGPFNFDLMFTESGGVFVIEIGPRNGGNRMPEAIRWATGVDTIAATVEVALGRPVELRRQRDRCCATYSVHAKRAGILDSIAYARELERRIVDELRFVEPGAAVERFTMGSLMLGNLILGFDGADEMRSMIERMDDLVDVRLRRSGASG